MAMGHDEDVLLLGKGLLRLFELVRRLSGAVAQRGRLCQVEMVGTAANKCVHSVPNEVYATNPSFERRVRLAAKLNNELRL